MYVYCCAPVTFLVFTGAWKEATTHMTGFFMTLLLPSGHAWYSTLSLASERCYVRTVGEGPMTDFGFATAYILAAVGRCGHVDFTLSLNNW